MMHRRIIFLLAVVAIAFFIWFSSALYEVLNETLIFSKESIELYPILGIFIFLVFAIMSAMLVFFTSIIFVPVAVFAWGETATFFLLLLGWSIGAIIAYFIGKKLGRTAVEYILSKKKISGYDDLVTKEMGIFDVILLKLALPSEVPSFFLGIVHYPFLKYILVVIISELPFAIWAVYLSGVFIEDKRLVFTGVLIASVALLSIAERKYRKKRNGLL